GHGHLRRLARERIPERSSDIFDRLPARQLAELHTAAGKAEQDRVDPVAAEKLDAARRCETADHDVEEGRARTRIEQDRLAGREPAEFRVAVRFGEID